MDKSVKVLLAICIFLACLMAAGIGLASLEHQCINPYHPSKIIPLSDGWTIKDDKGNTMQSSLPAKLPLQKNVTAISLQHHIPDHIPFEGVLWFSSMNQQVEIYIDEELRLSYGNTETSLRDFPYISGTHFMVVPLRQEDCGKKLEIRLSTHPFYTAELRLVRNVEIGSHPQFILKELADNFFLAVSVIIGMVTCLCLFFVWILQLFRKQKWNLPLICAVVNVFWILFMANDNTFLWVFFHYSPLRSTMAEIWFYTLDGLLPIVTYSILWRCDKRIFQQPEKVFVIIHIATYILASVLHLTGIISINLARPILMAISIAVYSSLLIRILKMKIFVNRIFIASVFSLMIAYFIDYLKYALLLFPLWGKHSQKLYFNFSYMFVLCLGMIIFCALVINGVARKFAFDKAKAEGDLRVTNMQIELYQNRYDQMIKNNFDMRRMRHDMIHHLRTICALFSGGEKAQAEEYLQKILNDVKKTEIREYTKNNIMNITLSWFADQAELNQIDFFCETNVSYQQLNRDKELCIVLSNALQNALEACAYVKDHPFIRVKIKLQGNMMLILTENSFDGNFRQENSEFVSRKTEKDHGYGLSGIQAIAENSGGWMRVSAKDKIFQIDIVLGDVFEANSEQEQGQNDYEAQSNRTNG